MCVVSAYAHSFGLPHCVSPVSVSSSLLFLCVDFLELFEHFSIVPVMHASPSVVFVTCHSMCHVICHLSTPLCPKAPLSVVVTISCPCVCPVTSVPCHNFLSCGGLICDLPSETQRIMKDHMCVCVSVCMCVCVCVCVCVCLCVCMYLLSVSSVNDGMSVCSSSQQHRTVSSTLLAASAVLCPLFSAITQQSADKLLLQTLHKNNILMSFVKGLRISEAVYEANSQCVSGSLVSRRQPLTEVGLGGPFARYVTALGQVGVVGTSFTIIAGRICTGTLI